MKIVALFIGILILSACSEEQPILEKAQQQIPETNEPAASHMTHTDSIKAPKTSSSKKTSPYHYTTIYTDQIGWGYDILENSSVRIHQPHIPAVQGNQGFKSASDAAKVAEKIIEKLDKGIMPPTLSIAEMEELGVL